MDTVTTMERSVIQKELSTDVDRQPSCVRATFLMVGGFSVLGEEARPVVTRFEEKCQISGWKLMKASRRMQWSA